MAAGAGGKIHSGAGQEITFKIAGRVLQRATAMARILIRCPTFKKAVPTGLTTNKIKLDSLDLTLSLVCPACGMVHEWKQADARIERGQEDE